ncbi:hypothetical protein [Aliarcobacter butzleri]|uniref:O-antigen ligase domain-containing protein n=1 Tax=Aliarcobacter butzleri TaxID=28197 RepID=A0AAW7Q4D3_9BACT|nr:hypothetical protein [Aliarcobacter butzleri]MDN5114344.1 hypothetical protein [Aliarcobacter butzleri]
MYLSYKFSKQIIFTALFAITVFFLTRQVPYNNYSFIMNITLLLFIVLSFFSNKIDIKEFDKKLINIFGIFLSTLLLYSILIAENDINHALKFYIILTLLFLTYFIKGNKAYIDVFLILITLQAIVVIGIFIFMSLNFDLTTYLPIRKYFELNEWGDVYTFDGNFWYVKIRGNALLPIGFFISILYLSGYKRIFVSGMILLACIFSNTAFLLAIGIFLMGLIFLKLHSINKKVYLLLFLLLTGILFSFMTINFNIDLFSAKESSMRTRYDQFSVLVNDLFSHNITSLFGTGLGHTIDIVSSIRDYRGDIYFELQTLYIANQLGLIFFLFYFIGHFVLALIHIKRYELLFVYVCYLIYAFSNPYVFDTNHFVVIVLLLSLRKVFDEKNILNTRSI